MQDFDQLTTSHTAGGKFAAISCMTGLVLIIDSGASTKIKVMEVVPFSMKYPKLLNC